MGYLIDGVILAGCVGAYRVYTDARRSVLHNNWDAYRHLFLNMSRNGGDFVASTCIDACCQYPDSVSRAIASSRPYLQWIPVNFEEFRRGVLLRAARYRVWSQCEHLGYLQRVLRVNERAFSLFDSGYVWKRSLLYTSPTMLAYVKDGPTREYLHALSAVRDSYVGVVEGTGPEIHAFVHLLQSRKKDFIQDIRKGHILDRYPESSVGIVHPLRMEIEGFLFLNGPDSERASYVDTVLSKPKIDIEALFPLLECIVDYSESESLTDLNVPVIRPLLFVGDRPIGISLGIEDKPSYIVDPMLWAELGLDQDIQPGHTIMLLGRPMSVVGMHGKVPTVRPC